MKKNTAVVNKNLDYQDSLSVAPDKYTNKATAFIRTYYELSTTTTAPYTDKIHTPCGNSVSKPQGKYRETIMNSFNVQDDSVLDFVDLNIELASLLIEAHKNIRERFPKEKLDLAFVEDMQNKLEITINGFVNDDDAFLKFNELNENWWFDRIEEDSVTMYPFIVLNIWG